MNNKVIVLTIMSFCSIYFLLNIPTTFAQNQSSTTNSISNKTVNINIIITYSIPNLKYMAFDPSQVKIKTGTTVMWTNKDTSIHTVTSGSPYVYQIPFNNNQNATVLFDSGFLAPGESFKHTFDKPGKYPFYDSEDKLTGAIYVVQ